jgi:protein TilB
MLGNPSQSNWEGFNNYVIASLPQLQLLDGKEIHRSDRIKALQVFPRLQVKKKRPNKYIKLIHGCSWVHDALGYSYMYRWN